MFAFVVALAPIAKAEAPELNYGVYTISTRNICERESILPSTTTEAYVNNIELYNDQETDSWLSFLAVSPKLYSLAKCESGLNPKAIGDLNLDEPAHGLFQWRKSSYLTFSRKYNIYPSSSTDKQIKDDVFNVENQIKLTGIMLTKEPNGWKHWLNCANKLH